MINRMNLIQIERQDPGFKRGTPWVSTGCLPRTAGIPESWEKGTGLSTFLAFFYEASRAQIKWWDLNKEENSIAKKPTRCLPRVAKKKT